MTAERILIDATMARNGGGFTYLVNLLPRLLEQAPDRHFRVLLRSAELRTALPTAPRLETALLPEVGLPGRLRFTYTRAAGEARRWGADVFFAAGDLVPLRAACPMIASFRNPNVFTDLKQRWGFWESLRLFTLRRLAGVSARAGDRIMFVSEDSAGWIGDRVGLAEERRAVIHHGIDLDRWTKRAAPFQHPRPYILSVSSVYRYKNFVSLIEAYAALAARRPQLPDLIIVGDNQDPEYQDRMEAARLATGDLAERIHFTGEVPYEAVQSYYAGASLFVFPSYLETFGHPMLEAMATGVPVVASDIGVFRELGGDAAFYADPHRSEAFASAMEAVLFEPEAAEQLVKRGEARVKEFTWDRTATRLAALFREVISDRARQPAAGYRSPAAVPPSAVVSGRLART